jgi:adenine deaminase
MKQIQGNIVDIFNEKIRPGTIYFDSHIQEIMFDDTLIVDTFIIPGFVDAHIHIESSMLIPSEFARLAVLHGTVATVSDPHEIGNVLGKEGVKFMIENGEKTPFKFYFGAPSCVPATIFETAGATISAEDIKEILAWENVHYLAEMMNYPGVYFEDPEVIAKIEVARAMNKVIDGHLPGIRGEMAEKYIKTGISTDHECFELDEALEKIGYGMKIIIREGSAAKNFEKLWPLINLHPDKVMFCSDDKHPNDLVISHINALAKRAISKGCSIFDVLRACSKNPIEHYGLQVGMLRENDPADFCVVHNLTDFEVLSTWINGKRVAENNTSLIPSVVEDTINNFCCSKITPESLQFPYSKENIRVIAVEDGQLITHEEIHPAKIENNFVVADLEKDIVKVVVVNRYKDAPPSISFLKNSGLKKGSIASCVAHDSHNIIALGTNDVDLAAAINLIIEHKGGVSLSCAEKKLIVALPVAGIMSNKDAYAIAEDYEKIDGEAKQLGCTLQAPFMTLSFCALLVIPALKLSDKGLFDARKFEFVDSSLS